MKAGHFASIDEAVQSAVIAMQIDYDEDDMAWAKPLVEEARASLARGEGVSLEEHRARMKRRLDAMRD